MVLVSMVRPFLNGLLPTAAACCHHPSTAVARSGAARNAPAGTRTAPAAKSTRRRRAKSTKRRRGKSTSTRLVVAAVAPTPAAAVKMSGRGSTDSSHSSRSCSAAALAAVMSRTAIMQLLVQARTDYQLRSGRHCAGATPGMTLASTNTQTGSSRSSHTRATGRTTTGTSSLNGTI